MNLETIQILIATNKLLQERRHTPALTLYIQHALSGVRSIGDQYADYLVRRWEVAGK